MLSVLVLPTSEAVRLARTPNAPLPPQWTDLGAAVETDAIDEALIALRLAALWTHDACAVAIRHTSHLPRWADVVAVLPLTNTNTKEHS